MRTALVAWLLVAPVAGGQEAFEAVVAGYRIPVDFRGSCGGDFQPRVQWFNPDSVEARDDIGGETAFLARSDDGRVYAVIGEHDLTIAVISPGGARTPFFAGEWPYHPINLGVAPSGHVFALGVASFGAGVVASVTVVSPAGQLEATYPLPGSSQSSPFAVANDGCTLLYGKAATVGRFDACTGTPLSDLMTAPQYVEDIEVLPDGRLLLLAGADIVLYDGVGRFVRTVTRLSWSDGPVDAEIAGSPDGRRVYAAVAEWCELHPASLLEFSIEEGRLLSRRPIVVDAILGLVIGNAVSTGEPAPVPMTTDLGLLVLALAVASAAVHALRR